MAAVAAQHIAQGQFVAQYAGEVLTNKEADNRLAQYDTQDTGVGHALLVGAPCVLPALAHFLLYDRVLVPVNLLSSLGSSRNASFWQSLPTFQHRCYAHWKRCALLQS